MQAEGRIERAAVIDLDVHQGNGTAAIFATDDSVFTASVHGANNVPFHKTESDLDVALADGTDDDDFLKAVREATDRALSTAPDLVFYVAGADPYQYDRLGRLAVSKKALAQRDSWVIGSCGARHTPVVTVMSGGYASDIHDTVDIHFHSIATMAESFRSAA